MITINSKDLQFNLRKCKFVTEDGETVKITKNITYERLEKTEFFLEKKVPMGKHAISIVYSGVINNELNGLYQTKYFTSEGVERIAAVTKHEPFYARRLVPCFDEPRYKATWNVTIIHPKGTTALSNNIEIGEPEPEDDLEGDFLMTHFKKTPPMSSYLFAIFVSDFTFLEKYTKSGIRFRVWTRKEAKEKAEYALEAGIKCLEAYEKLFGIDFPLEKQDMVALPDFASGAMENWGMITYREALLIYDRKNYYYTNKIRVTTIIAHELAHAWFGNLVTMKWWDDIWLNEGFAAFIQQIGADIIADSVFQLEESSVSESLRQSLQMDSTAASHPIVYNTTHATEIPDLFDVVSYRKGSSFLAMIRNIIGKEVFIKGIQNYLKKYSYQNADHLQLFDELDQVIEETTKGPDGKKLNITDFALRWTHQMGYPYVSLLTVNSTHYQVIQKRYKIDPKAKERTKFSNPPYGYKWDVPIWIQEGKKPEVSMKWLPAEGELFLEKRDEPVVLNADSYAIASINYENEGWERIFEQLELNHLIYTPRTRYRIIADVFAMAAIDKVSYGTAFNVSRYLVNEKDYLPWLAMSNEIDMLYEYFGNSKAQKVLDSYVAKLIEPRLYDIDIRYTLRSINDNQSYMKERLNVHLWLLYCKVMQSYCADTVKLYFNGALQGCKAKGSVLSKCGRIPPPIRNYIYNEAVRTGSEETYHTLMQFYKHETLQLERERLLSALSSTPDPEKLQAMLRNISSPRGTLFRRQDCVYVGNYLTQNKNATEFLLPFLIENWDDINSKFYNTPAFVNKLCTSLTSGISTEEDLNKLKKFLDSNENTKRYYTFIEQVQRSERRIKWLKNNSKSLEALLPKMFE